ncbi:hypothetical protein ASPZODRAFT_18943 [Penicilliopsis zonata CBS 506.65]|uniref:Uncharacterized protein n=1 Tax=Penicilliopsis zonata CBS 506.65 TaxID=1073090 RepID=A0A1L9SAG0_9EURO|nr:hypothetical protein ASPZODRAFT_18943 [Penicilliopsis zonata CBS 506.65]OJJ44175.1 hypothetical protein ASPZODRAFT_18943 [Penicilliopsis zonata CBS 506.65]
MSTSIPYLISKFADPIFAFTIGTAAAAVRIRRDQQEKYPERASEIGYGVVLADGGRRLQRWWRGDFSGL